MHVIRIVCFLPFSCPTKLDFRAFFALATSLSVTVVHKFILLLKEKDRTITSALSWTNIHFILSSEQHLHSGWNKQQSVDLPKQLPGYYR